MKTRVIAYVYGVVAAAAASVFALHSVSPEVIPTYLVGVLALTFVAFIGTYLSYKTKGNTAGAVAFIPYLTALVLYPSWATSVIVGVGALVAEVVKPKMAIKRAFNVAQIVLSCSAGSLVYLMCGGKSLLSDPSFNVVPHTIAVFVFLSVNTSSVAAVVSLAEGKPFLRTWLEGNAAGLLYDVGAVPVVYAFARAYVDWGFVAVVVLAMLLVGLRLTYHSKYQLERTNEDLLKLFVQTVEYRDPYTSGHSQRVSRYSSIIADLCGLPERKIDRIAMAGLLHDVGKIHEIFAPILSKPGRLTPEERAIMELHPIKSAELVEKISALEDIVPDVLHHHENWDGTGYPHQLQGKEIPLGSRIIMFADTIDAMTTDRPYRKALGEADVRQEIMRYRGIQFDPEICDVLLASPEFKRLFDKDDSGRIKSLTQRLEKLVKSRVKTPAVA